MFVNCFTVTILSKFYETTIKGTLGFITHLFWVDENINVEEICEKYKCKMGRLYKIQIEEYMYNNNYIIQYMYNKEGLKFYLEL